MSTSFRPNVGSTAGLLGVTSGCHPVKAMATTKKAEMCIMNKSFLIVSSYLGMNIFVAFFLLLLLLADSTPPAASTVPLIGRTHRWDSCLIACKRDTRKGKDFLPGKILPWTGSFFSRNLLLQLYPHFKLPPHLHALLGWKEYDFTFTLTHEHFNTASRLFPVNACKNGVNMNCR